jgi:hypothetical protein
MYAMEREMSRITFGEQVFFKDEETKLAQLLRDSFVGPIDRPTADSFVNGTCRPEGQSDA